MFCQQQIVTENCVYSTIQNVTLQVMFIITHKNFHSYLIISNKILPPFFMDVREMTISESAHHHGLNFSKEFAFSNRFLLSLTTTLKAYNFIRKRRRLRNGEDEIGG